MSYVAKCRKATAKRVERKYACPSCDARFPFPNKLRLHINSNHSLANVCELCPERFNRFNELRTHMRRAHQIVHQCHLCAYSSSVKAELRKHVVKCHENGVRCTVDGCDATVAYNRLRRHIKEAHCGSLQGGLIVDNRMPRESSEPENNLSEDLIEVEFSSTAEGSTTTNAFSRMEFVNNFQPMEKMQKLASNHVSPEVLPRDAEASTHRLSLAVQHDGTTAENEFSDCCGGVQFGKAIEMKGINSENIYQEKSQEVSSEPNGLKREDKTMSRKISLGYTETGGYECQKCGKIFHNVYNSRRHWNRVHLKKHVEAVRLKKYECKISECTQRFSCPSKLQDHMLTIHSEDAPFDCETCNRKFSSRASFAIHLRRYHLVSIRNVPYGFTDGIGVSSVNVSNEIHISAKDNASDADIVVTNNIFAKE
ncbi:unnamed protein product [Cercopithifilaria johnstoni]|uniref:C2H2-type domain-containing protein n=1 Tax=Cercopithifilaria johnstoni TaxID=2874296 RepID=A0A8J2M2G9_9BILA|nr:unnamed protein product [Cercopithifilaria johnstoni]